MWMLLVLPILLASVHASPQWNIPDLGLPKLPQVPGIPKIPGIHSIAFPEDARQSSSSRIVNGWPAELGQFPYQVRSKTKKGPHKYSICGGSILSKTVVLTAAHCTIGHDSFDLGFGSVTFSDPAVEITATKKIVHEDYNPQNLNNDIALLILPEELTFTDNIAPVQLPSYSQKSKTFLDAKATVSGHGKTGDNERTSGPLLYVHTKVIANKDCRKVFGPKQVKPFTLCVVGWDNANQSTCKGDSGGPLVTQDEDLGEVIQIGIVSYVAGDAGCEGGLPTGFVRVSHYLDWIHDNSGVEIRP